MAISDYERARLRLQAFAMFDGWGYTNAKGEHIEWTLEKRQQHADEFVEWALSAIERAKEALREDLRSKPWTTAAFCPKCGLNTNSPFPCEHAENVMTAARDVIAKVLNDCDVESGDYLADRQFEALLAAPEPVRMELAAMLNPSGTAHHFTPAEIELMMEDAERHRAGTVQRTPDGYLRTYYGGFNLTTLAEHICREMAQPLPARLNPWRPIETAPKDEDETSILIGNNRHNDCRVAYYEHDADPTYPWHVEDAAKGFNHHRDWPTHWMPRPSLPAPPSEDKT